MEHKIKNKRFLNWVIYSSY